MEKQEITLEDLERFAEALAQAIPHLDCPEQCEQSWKYQYVEMSADLYREEWEWHCLASVIHAHHRKKKQKGP
ncbi:hypothetical protein EGT07_01660 [Herbaspirillum sp. HC18]|nr:hypothetical protein EGT07_01660 [Herbaspirillum sp. HC18]